MKRSANRRPRLFCDSQTRLLMANRKARRRQALKARQAATCMRRAGGRDTRRHMALEALECRNLLSATAYAASMLKDTNITPASSNPQDIVAVGNEAFFVATDQGHGSELWKSDGTSAGTILVKDIAPGTAGSYPQNLTNVSGTVFFTVDDELWKSDGSAADTVEVAAIPRGTSEFISSLTPSNGKLFFLAGSDVDDSGSSLVEQLWVTDGTAAGTVELQQFSQGLSAADLTDVNGTLYLTANSEGADGGGGPVVEQLWRSDGTASGTVPVQSLSYATGDSRDDRIESLINVAGTAYLTEYVTAPGFDGPDHWLASVNAGGVQTDALLTFGNSPTSVVAAGADVLFTDGQKLYDYSPATSTVQASIGLGSIDSFAVANGNAYFFSMQFDSSGNFSGYSLNELAGPNFTSGAPTQIWQSQELMPSPFVSVNGVLFFEASPARGGTSQFSLFDVQGSSVSLITRTLSSSADATAVGDLLFFAADDGVHGTELWKSDGSLSGTAMVKDINPGTADSNMGQLLTVGDNGYFAAGYDLWKTDGTPAGTSLVAASAVGGQNGFYEGGKLTSVNGRAVFVGSDQALWASDGTPAGTQSLLSASGTATSGTGSENPVELGSKWYFLITPNSGGTSQLWQTDGTPGGTSAVVTSGLPDFVGDLTEFDGALYFLATGSAGAQLWTSNGTASGTSVIRDLAVGSPYGSVLQAIGNTLFIGAGDGFSGNSSLFASNGTSTGTALIANVQGFQPQITSVNGTFVFAATEAAHGNELWASDGTPAGTSLLNDINPGSGDSNPQGFVSLGNLATFVASGAPGTYQLYSTDGTASGLRMLRDFGSLEPTSFTLLNGKAYFIANDGSQGWQLWVTDGTAAGTLPITDVNSSGGGLEPNNASSPTTLSVVGGKIYFSGSDGVHGDEPWSSDGTTAGTAMLYDIDPGPGGSAPSNFAELNGKIVLSADDGIHGVEPYSLTPIVPVSLVAGSAVKAVEGAAATQTLATFTDPNGRLAASQYQAAVAWGDGSEPTAGVVSGPDAEGVFTVSASHTYSDEAQSLPVMVSVSRDGGATASAQTTASIDDAPITIDGRTIDVTEGSEYTGTLASFSDANPLARVTDFTAAIDWGDGSSGGVVTAAGSTFIVSGSHTFAKALSNAPVTIIVSDKGGSSATVRSSADVADAPLSGTAASVTPTEQTTFTGAVATFTDGNAAATAGDFTSTIDWGDGATTTGNVSSVGDGFQVAGAHTYAKSGVENITVVINDAGGSSATINSTASVSEAATNGTSATLSGTAGTAVAGTIATFMHGDGSQPASDFTATIDWGDGQTSAGTIAETGGTYSVAATHTYASSGTFDIKTTIVEEGVSTMIGGSAVIAAGGTPHQRYVAAVFQDVLGRAVDPSGLAYWAGKLDGGMPISGVAAAIAHSDEYYGNFVIKPDYLKLLGRAADASGVAYWTGKMQAGVTDQQLEADLVSSPEFYKTAGGTNTAWIDAVYKLLLGRAADASGETYWNGKLTAGETLNQAAQGIAGSPENDTQLINDDYFHYLGRAADPGGLAHWLAEFKAGQTNEDVIAGFTGAAEYYKEKTS